MLGDTYILYIPVFVTITYHVGPKECNEHETEQRVRVFIHLVVLFRVIGWSQSRSPITSIFPEPSPPLSLAKGVGFRDGWAGEGGGDGGNGLPELRIAEINRVGGSVCGRV